MAERRDRHDEPGAIVGRAIESLRAMPPVDEQAVERIVAAAARTRAQDSVPNDDDLLPLAAPVPTLGRLWPRWAIAAAAVAGIALAWVELQRVSRPAAVEQATVGSATTDSSVTLVSATPVARGSISDASVIPTQFVFDGHARHVVLVGDFNNWDEHATPLEPEPGSALWSVTVPITRGRHIYAFLVDSVWTVDRRAPVARDPDFGVTGSVILVGRP